MSTVVTGIKFLEGSTNFLGPFNKEVSSQHSSERGIKQFHLGQDFEGKPNVDTYISFRLARVSSSVQPISVVPRSQSREKVIYEERQKLINKKIEVGLSEEERNLLEQLDIQYCKLVGRSEEFEEFREGVNELKALASKLRRNKR